MKSRVRIAIIIGIVLVVIGYGWMRLSAKATDKPTIGRTVEAKTGTISLTVSENGTLEPVTQVELKSKVSGRIQKIFVKEGDLVKEGDIIALIDPIEILRGVDQIKAQRDSSVARLHQAEENYYYAKRQSAVAVQRARASLKEAETHLIQTAAPTRVQDIQQQEEAVQKAEVALKRAEAALAHADATVDRSDAQILDAQRNLDRQIALVGKGFVSQSAVDAAQTNLKLMIADKAVSVADRNASVADKHSLETDLASAKQHLALLKEGPRREDIDNAKASLETAKVALQAELENAKQVEVRKRDIESARGDVAQIENQLGQQDVQLKETKLIAPLSGEITGKYLNEGELVASATAGFAQGAVVVRVADLNKMQVKVNVNEVDVAKLKIGLPVDIKIDSIPDRKFAGTVTDIAPSSIGSNSGSTTTTQGAVVRFEVKIRVTTPDRRLRPGMTAAVDIILDRHENVTVLPAEALRPGDKVMVVTGKGKDTVKTERSVKIGLKNYGDAEIIDGLKPGDKVEVPKIVAKDRRKINVGGPDDNKDDNNSSDDSGNKDSGDSSGDKKD